MTSLQSILDELNISRDVIDLIILVGLSMIFFFIVSCIIDISKLQKGSEKYIGLFSKEFDEKKNIKLTMEAVLKEYGDKTMESKALKAGLYYLEHSIMKDYQGALRYIENVFDSNDVRNEHRRCLEISYNARIMALEDSKETQV